MSRLKFKQLILTLVMSCPVFFGQALFADAKPLKKVKLALDWKPEPEFGGFYAALIGGHFKKNGLDVEIVPGGAGTPVVQMIAAGKMEFGTVNADEVVISRSRGADVVALYATFQTCPHGIMVHPEHGFKSLKDVYAFNGGTLALQKGMPYTIFLQNKFGKPKVQVVPYQGGIAPFLADKKFAQQVFVAAEPVQARRRGLKPQTFLVASEGYNPYTTVMVARGDLIKTQAEMVKAMVAAVRAGWSDYLKDPSAANRMMGELNKAMDARSFKESAEEQKALIMPEGAGAKAGVLGAMSEARWKKLIDQLHEMKVISKKPDVKRVFVTL